MLRALATLVIAVGVVGNSEAQSVDKPITINLDITGASTLVYINQSQIDPTFSFSSTGVDLASSGIEEQFDFCVQGTTNGGFKLRHTNFLASVGGTPVRQGNSASSINARLLMSSIPNATTFIGLNDSETSQSFDYGAACSLVSEPQTYTGRIEIAVNSGVTSITPGAYSAVLNLQVIPQ